MIIVYSCGVHSIVTSLDIPNAVAPAFINCPHCKQIATNQGETEGTATHEWYIPEKKGRGITKEVKRQFKTLGIYLREIKTEEK